MTSIEETIPDDQSEWRFWNRRLIRLVVCLGLAILTVQAYWGVRKLGLVYYDDPQYYSENLRVQKGLDRESVKWAFISCEQSNWHPITWLSHMLDIQAFGFESPGDPAPCGPHMVNLLLHTLNALLLFLLFEWMSGAIWPSAFVAAMFAVHPMHVESVAWVAERKDVLSTLFGLLTLAAYLWYARLLKRRGFDSLSLRLVPLLACIPSFLLMAAALGLEVIPGWLFFAACGVMAATVVGYLVHLAASESARGRACPVRLVPIFAALQACLAVVVLYGLGTIDKSRVAERNKFVDGVLDTLNRYIALSQPTACVLAFVVLLALSYYLAYLQWQKAAADSPRVRRGVLLLAKVQCYVVMLTLFLVCLMAKPMLVTLPCVLLLLDYWPLGRLRFVQESAAAVAAPTAQRRPLRRRQPGGTPSPAPQWDVSLSAVWLVLEKLPLMALAAASSQMTYFAQQKGGSMAPPEALPLDDRIGNAVLSYVKYIGKMFWPGDMAAFYPLNLHLPPEQVLWAKLVLCAITLAVLVGALVFHRRYLAVGWAWFLGVLVPVIGLVQVGDQALADRYTYLSYIGLFIIVAWGASDLLGRWLYGRVALGIAAMLILATCSIWTMHQIPFWSDPATLMTHTLKVDPENPAFENNFGVLEWQSGQKEQARGDREAIAAAQEAAKQNPDEAKRHRDAAADHWKKGKQHRDAAIAHWRQAIKLKEVFSDAHNNLGCALLDPRSRDLDGAIRCFLEAIKYKPEHADALGNLGSALSMKGQLDKAEPALREALRVRPDFPDAQKTLGALLLQTHRWDEAAQQFQAVCDLRSDDLRAAIGLALARLQQGRWNDAREMLAALLAARNVPEARCLLAWLLATCPEQGLRNGNDAVALIEPIVAANRRTQAISLDVLAAALAEAGRFDDALEAAQRAVMIAEEERRQAVLAGKTELARQRAAAAEAVRARVALYRDHKPYRSADGSLPVDCFLWVQASEALPRP